MMLKTITIVSATLLSLNLWACPQLEGTYRCTVNGTTAETTITQDLRNDVWTFTVSSDETSLEVVADGRTYSVNNLGEIRNASYTATCSNEKLSITASGDVYSGGRRIGRGNSVMGFSKQPNSNGLVAQTTVSMGGFSLPPQTVNCPKL